MLQSSHMKVVNRNFHRTYEEIESFEAGIMLTGAEVKSVRAGNIRLENSFVRIENSEAYLINADIPIYQFARPAGYDPVRRRKLLLHKKELTRLQTKMTGAGKLTIAPIVCYTKGRHIKLSIALVKGRGEIGKKILEMHEDIKRDQEREMKDYMKK